VNGLFKSAIWVRTLFFAVIPFMVVYSIISVFIGKFVFQDKIRQTKVDIETLARFNETNLQGYIEDVRLAVKIAAVQLGNIDPRTPDARKTAESALFSCFENWQLYNAWFVFETNAFDGRDAEYSGSYPGAPSGRFIRSFVRDENGGFLATMDMDETTIDDPDESYWYTIPKESGRQYTDINVPRDFLYDYGLGGGEVAAVSIVCPIVRDDTVIGCAGGDFLLDDVILGPELIPGAQSVLFMDNGAVKYANDIGFLGKNVEELGFPYPGKIREAFTRQEAFFLYDEYSGLLGGKAYSYFMPVRFAEFDEIMYIYAAVPKNVIMETVYSVFRPIVAALAAALIIFTFLLFYLAKSISEPIRKLTAASEAIARGDFNGKFEAHHSRGEIGAMARSLYHMVEQFQMYITLQERSRELLDIYTRFYEALYQRDSIEDVFDAAIFIIADYFKIKTASLIVLKNDAARYMAQYSAEKGLWRTTDESNAVVFEYHNQTASLLAGKKYIFLNAAGISEQGIVFAAEDSVSLCILPVRSGEILRAYFLIEGNEATGPFVHYDDALIFISDTISYILTQKENTPAHFDRPPAGLIPVQPEHPEDYPPEQVEPVAELPVIQAARNVGGLDVDRGLSLVGGMEDQYGELLRISVKVFSEGIQKMRGQYVSDLPGFAIGIHGMKSALYNIGANELGDAAKKLEFAAKGGDAAFCRKEYPVFETQLADLVQDLTEVTRTEAGEGGAGSISELEAALEKTLEACRNFDAIQAGRIISPFTGFTWEPEDIGTDVKAVAETLENIDYDEAEDLINSLIKKVRGFESGSRNSGGGIEDGTGV
jgi:HAMP domain-containing protein/HPt (histidine-containing phosphotransfer) domain-containing protein